MGADATFNHRLPFDEQLKDIAQIAGGKFSRVFDASAFAAETGLSALTQHGDPQAKVRYFATTNDWLVPTLFQPSPIQADTIIGFLLIQWKV